MQFLKNFTLMRLIYLNGMIKIKDMPILLVGTGGTVKKLIQWNTIQENIKPEELNNILGKLDIEKNNLIQQGHFKKDIEKILKEFRLLRNNVQTHPVLSSEFRGGLLKVPPLKLSLNVDADSTINKTSTVRPLAFKELLIVKE
eukprot:snap_masked-scaffold_30-processed-gene-3.49-mRNA-1 protein AED:1.00 eAED:1.00 QI:0/0/0/0/1/1/2/0/142